MALERKDNIGDTSSTTGTGTLDLLAAAQSGARIFAGNVTSGATVRYDIRSSDNTEWEIGEGVFTDGSPDTLTRVTVYASSNAGSLVNFSAGTKNVSMVATAQDFVGEIAPPNLLKNGNFINNSTNGYGSTPDDWISSNANPVQGGVPALTKQNLIDGLGIADGDIEAWYNCNGGFTDLGSNGYNLTAGAGGAAPTDSSDGLMAQAKSFASASSQYASAAAANANITGAQTFIAFFKPTTLVQGVLIGFAQNPTGQRHIRTETTGVVTLQLTGLSVTLPSDVLLTAGKWNMIVGIYNGSNTLNLWINGIKKTVAVTGSVTALTSNLAIGRREGYNDLYQNGVFNNCGVLSVALTDNQVKKLFAMTMYKGQKIRRATTNAYAYQQLPQDLVEKLRGKTVALRADLYQEVASTAQISIHQTMADGTTDEAIISATDATTGSWLSKVATGTLEADVVTVEIRIKHSTTDGNTWFKNVSLYEGSTLLPYDHSKEDWSRFPRLLKMDIPPVFSGYQYEEDRWFSWTTTRAVSGGTAPTYTANDLNTYKISGKQLDFFINWNNGSGGTAGAGANRLTFTLPASNADFADGRSIIGSVQGYEDAGTIGQFMIYNDSNAYTGAFWTTLLVNVSGADQSSTVRFISGSGFFKID